VQNEDSAKVVVEAKEAEHGRERADYRAAWQVVPTSSPPGPSTSL
jgi:hypothetical protein